VPGDLVRVRAMKWPALPHWEFDGRWLGSDEHGDWIGFPAGTRFERPGHGFTATWDSVTLFPRAGWAASFSTGHPRGVGTYVDIATVPEWRADASVSTLSSVWTVSYVDLDLDVVERAGAPAFIEDEDEFAEHAVELGYPPEVVARARVDADAVLVAVQRREAPFDGATAAGWLDRLA
jgi:protein associated with RNAse G/E